MDVNRSNTNRLEKGGEKVEIINLPMTCDPWCQENCGYCYEMCGGWGDPVFYYNSIVPEWEALANLLSS